MTTKTIIRYRLKAIYCQTCGFKRKYKIDDGMMLYSLEQEAITEATQIHFTLSERNCQETKNILIETQKVNQTII